MLDCPSAATLAGLGTVMMETGILESLECHIEVCPDCQAKLERLARQDAIGEWPTSPVLPGPDKVPTIPGFSIEHELGRGSMGVVYQAFDRNLGRRVALKVVRSGPTASSHDHVRWLREARSFARVRHDNVVRLYQLGEADGWLYMVLELVPGGTLEERLKTPFVPRDAAVLLETITRAVIAIHSEGLVHLDLKPSNILLDARSETPCELAVPRVGDFGIALRSDEPDASLATALLAGPMGTPSYMAPEQVAFDREKIGPTADVYGLGAILYHLLTGHRPFAAAGVIDTLDQVRNREPVPPRRLNPTLPRDLETICLKCLQKEPGRRYASAAALADDFRRFLDGEAIAARPISALEKTWRWCRRRPAVAALATLLMITLCTSFLGLVRLWRHAETQSIRAESDFQIANEMLGQIVDLSTGGQGGVSRVVSPEHLIEVLTQVRQSLRKLAARRTDDPTIARQLALVDQRLCDTLMQEERWLEARSMLEESVAGQNAILQRNPDDPKALATLSASLLQLAAVAEKLGRGEESVQILRHAVRSAEAWALLMPDDAPLDTLARSRESLSLLLVKRGEREESRSLMLANRRLLDGFPAECENPNIMAWRIQVHSDFTFWIDGESSVPSAGLIDDLRVGRGPLSRLASAEANRLPAEAWAELAADVFGPESRAGTSSTATDAFASNLCQLQARTASKLRSLGEIEAARRVSGRLLAFGRLLVERYPDRPAAYLVLGEALMQLSKNAWKTRDRVAIERNLKLAIEATEHRAGPRPQPRSRPLPSRSSSSPAQGSVRCGFSRDQCCGALRWAIRNSVMLAYIGSLWPG